MRAIGTIFLSDGRPGWLYITLGPAVTRSLGSRPGVPAWLPLYWQAITWHCPAG